MPPALTLTLTLTLTLRPPTLAPSPSPNPNPRLKPKPSLQPTRKPDPNAHPAPNPNPNQESNRRASRRASAQAANGTTPAKGAMPNHGVSTFDFQKPHLIEQEQRQNARRASDTSARSSSTVSLPGSQGGGKAKGEAAGLGRLVLVPEIIASDKQYCWFVIGASNLRTENLSFPPSPFLKIFRLLADGTKAPVYETGHVRAVRECAWKTVPIPLQRLHNGDPLRLVVIEVWDYGDMSGNCCFAVATMPAAQLLQSHVEESDPEHAHMQAGQCAKSVPLQPPSGKERRRSATSTILGFGRAKSPGSLQVLRSEIDFTADSAMTVFKTFDIDSVRHEAQSQVTPSLTLPSPQP